MNLTQINKVSGTFTLQKDQQQNFTLSLLLLMKLVTWKMLFIKNWRKNVKKQLLCFINLFLIDLKIKNFKALSLAHYALSLEPYAFSLTP